MPPTPAQVEWVCDLSACTSLVPPPLPSVRVEVRCGPRALRAVFHFPKADEYTIRFTGAPTHVSASILAFVLREMVKGGRWRVVDTRALREMLGGEDVLARIEVGLYDAVKHEVERARMVEEAMGRAAVVPASAW
jgi:hypothetical protein